MFSESFVALVFFALTTSVDAAPTRQFLLGPLHEKDIANVRSSVFPSVFFQWNHWHQTDFASHRVSCANPCERFLNT